MMPFIYPVLGQTQANAATEGDEANKTVATLLYRQHGEPEVRR